MKGKSIVTKYQGKFNQHKTKLVKSKYYHAWQLHKLKDLRLNQVKKQGLSSDKKNIFSVTNCYNFKTHASF